MLYLVIKWQNSTASEVGIDADGTVQQDARQAELFATHEEAKNVANQHGGQVVTEERFFGADIDED